MKDFGAKDGVFVDVLVHLCRMLNESGWPGGNNLCYICLFHLVPNKTWRSLDFFLNTKNAKRHEVADLSPIQFRKLSATDGNDWDLNIGENQGLVAWWNEPNLQPWDISTWTRLCDHHPTPPNPRLSTDFLPCPHLAVPRIALGALIAIFPCVGRILTRFEKNNWSQGGAKHLFFDKGIKNEVYPWVITKQ